MIGVEVVNDDIECAIKRFKKTVRLDNIFPEIAFRLKYVKPSEKRRAKERKAESRRAKLERRRERRYA
jgi:ribosomal protein S21